jgi:hypothetical protein
MKIIKDRIISIAAGGRISLQIPQVNDRFRGVVYETEEIPDEWVIKLRLRRYPTTGSETGYLFLTEAGWKANKDKIREAFETAKFKRGSWNEFEQHALDHFKRVEKSTRRRVSFLLKKVRALQDTLFLEEREWML